jgi:hypothetical protein
VTYDALATKLLFAGRLLEALRREQHAFNSTSRVQRPRAKKNSLIWHSPFPSSSLASFEKEVGEQNIVPFPKVQNSKMMPAKGVGR